MNSFSKYLLGFGIIMTVAGVAGAGLTYRDMKTQNILHARQGVLPVNLGERSTPEEETFAFYQSGNHILYFTAIDAFGKSKGTELKEDLPFSGIFEVKITGPSGSLFLHRTVVSDASRRIKPNDVEWIALDTLRIQEPFEGIWKISAQVVEPDTNFSGTVCEVFIMPPQHYNIGMYMYGQTFKLVGWALLMLVGFVTIVFGGYMKRRAPKTQF